MWVLDLSGQHLGAGCVVGVSVRPLGTLLGNINLLKYKFVLNTTIWGIYAANNFESICKLNIYVSVGYSSLGMVVGVFGGRVGEYTFVKIWIYSANTLGIFFIIIYIMPTFLG